MTHNDRYHMAPAQDTIASLVAAHKLSAEEAEHIRTEAIRSGIAAEALLQSKRYVSQEDFVRAKADSLGFPFINLSGRAIAPDVVNFIPEPVARRYNLVPFQIEPSEHGALSVALVDPLDFQVVEFLERKSGRPIKPFMGLVDDIKAAIEE